MDVLVIEPDADLASIYNKNLRSRGIRALSVHSGQAAILALDKQPVRLICLELHLAEHNGFEFIHELRSYPDWDDIKIVLLTYIAEPDLLLTPSQRKQLGIVGYFYKPRVKLMQLAEFIKQEIT